MKGIIYIDQLEQKKNKIKCAGWIYRDDVEYEDMYLKVKNKNGEAIVPISYKIKREDVYKALNKENALYTGFLIDADIKVYGSATYIICAKHKDEIDEYIILNKHNHLIIDLFNIVKKVNINNIKIFWKFLLDKRIDELFNALKMPVLKENNIVYSYKKENIIDILNRFCIGEIQNENLEKIFLNRKVDIIIPVYNGYEYLEKLFSSIEKTRITHRVFIINDCSSDIRVNTYLKNIVKEKENYYLITNDNNIGFVKSVNKGLKAVNNHIILLNTDVEVPDKWIEKLMYPIFCDEKVATTTPYTNCGTICSFPNFLEDNDLYNGLSVDEVNTVFCNIRPQYLSMPTGVGFCMGMNFKVIQEIGYLDEENFGKGYGEENDWCQRAIKSGYKNVHVENLFVYHKHGGSFPSEEKKKLIENNLKKLNTKHPNYFEDTRRFIQEDGNKITRNILEFLLSVKYCKGKSCLIFNHMLGGGATSFIERYMVQRINQNDMVIQLSYDYKIGDYSLNWTYLEGNGTYKIDTYDELKILLNNIKINEIIFNELVTFPELEKIFNIILEIKNKKRIKLTYFLHDYYSICPSINLVQKEKYCGLPQICFCEKCSSNVQSYTIKKWREIWKNFLAKQDELIVFSTSSRDILLSVYPDLSNVVLRPHECTYLQPLGKKYKTTNFINIGLVGTLSKHKGQTLIKNIISILEEKRYNIRFILIGKCEEKIISPYFIETGEYTLGQFPMKILENDIDSFFISSIWPETFSYTSEEVMKMQIPVLCLNIGAPAERICSYKFGKVLDYNTDELLCKQIVEFGQEVALPIKNQKNILMLVEEFSFASRYRMEHLREKLLLEGIYTVIKKANIDIINEIKKYNYIIIYRAYNAKIVKEIINKAHKNNIKVIYDIDDYVFDYNKIQYLNFLKDEEYKSYHKYTENIYYLMSLCDYCSTSTLTLKNEIEKEFCKKVFLNRNVASMEMQIISNLALLMKKRIENGKIILGYFSGSGTHNKDFEIIAPVLLKLLNENKKLYLKLGGVLKLDNRFQKYEKQIIKMPFVDWRDLPKEICEVDINLMPLEDTLFHRCKSENKWMEAALVKVPTIASYNVELNNVINNHIDGVLCKDEGEWEKELRYLIDDKTARRNIAEAAYLRVSNYYITNKYKPEIIDLINECSSDS